MTDLGGYDEGKSLLPAGREFMWPRVKTLQGHIVDLSRPFHAQGTGFVTTQLVNTKSVFGFFAAVNTRLRLMIAYVFSKRDFPWAVLWEENCAIQAAPWKRRTQAVAVEFSNSPFPSGQEAASRLGNLFGLPTLERIPTRGTKTVRYCALLAPVPSELGIMRDLAVERDALCVKDARRNCHRLSARGIESFLMA